jgi:hypothetical protein
VEPFDLALCLRMPRRSVLLADPEDRQQVFERVAPAGEPGGVDAAVIGQRARWNAVSLDHIEEHGHDHVAGHRLMSGAGQQNAGVIIKPVQNLHIRAVSQAPMHEVRLPHLVRLSGLKPRIGGTRPLARLGCDQAGLVQDPADRRGRRRS